MRVALLLLITTSGYSQTSTITNITPGSNLLAPGGTSVALSFNTPQPALCRYSVRNAAAFTAMQPFDSGPAPTTHKGTVQSLSPSPATVNGVYLRCDSDPNSVTSLQYRAAASPSGAFPRIGSIWWGSYIDAENVLPSAEMSPYNLRRGCGECISSRASSPHQNTRRSLSARRTPRTATSST